MRTLDVVVMQEIRLRLLSGTESAIAQQKVALDSHINLVSQEYKFPNPFSVKQWEQPGLSPLRDRMMMEWVINHKEVMKIIHGIMADMDIALADLKKKLESHSKNPNDFFTVAVTCSTGRGLSPCVVECLHDYYSKAPPIDNLLVTTEHMVALHVPSASRDRLVWQHLPMLSINPLRSHHSGSIFQVLQTVNSPHWLDLPAEISSLVEAAFEKESLSSNVRVRDLVLNFRNGSMYSKTTSQQSLLRCSLLPQQYIVTVHFLQHKTYKPFISNFKAAGILPYSFHPISGEAVFLIGHVTYGSCTWSDFGGFKSIKIFSPRFKETPAEAAARECAEETMGVLGSEQHLLHSLRNYEENNAFKVINEDTCYVGHLLRVPFDHYPAKFSRLVIKPLADCSDVEVDEMRWLPLRSIKKAVQLMRSTTKHTMVQPIKERDGSLDEGVFLPLREEFAASLCIADELGFLNCIGHMAQLHREVEHSSLLDQPSESFRNLSRTTHKEREKPSGHQRMTDTENELRLLRLDAERKGSSMPGSHGDEHGCHGDQQGLTQQQQDSESDCSDYMSGNTQSDTDEDTEDILAERERDGKVCGTTQSKNTSSIERKKHKKRRKIRKTHSSKDRGREHFLQYGMGAGRLYYNPESFFSV